MKGTNTYYKTHNSMVLKMKIFNQYWIKMTGDYNIVFFIYMYQILK